MTVAKIVMDVLPDNFTCPRDTRDLLVACATEFVHLVASEANEGCEKAGRKTITPEHLVEALRNLGFPDYVPEVEGAWGEQQEAAKVKAERQKGRGASAIAERAGISEEELARQQEELFQAARAKLASSTNSPK